MEETLGKTAPNPTDNQNVCFSPIALGYIPSTMVPTFLNIHFLKSNASAVITEAVFDNKRPVMFKSFVNSESIILFQEYAY